MAILTPKRNFISGDTPTATHFNNACGQIDESPTMDAGAAAGDCVAYLSGTWTPSQSGIAIYDGTDVIVSGQVCVLAGLTAGSKYYAQTDFSIGTTVTEHPVGIALTTTLLYVLIPAVKTTSTINAQTDSYTAVASDAGKLIKITKASAATFTIPPNSSVAFPLETEMEIAQWGAGQITVTAGAGVTLRNADSQYKTAKQYATVGVKQIAADEWLVTGYVGA